jgi:hypothetical protein
MPIWKKRGSDEPFFGFASGLGLWNPYPSPGGFSADLGREIARLRQENAREAKGVARYEILKLAARQGRTAVASHPEPLTGEMLDREVLEAARTAVARNPLIVTNTKKHKTETMAILRQRGIYAKGGLGRHVDKAMEMPEFKSKRGRVGVTHKSMDR